MEKDKLQYFKEKLLTLRRDLAEQVKASSRFGREIDDGTLDSGDKASDTYLKQMVFDRGENESRQLELIESALMKIRDEDYGICEECMGPIPEKRLEIVPYAKYCVRCKEELEKKETKVSQD